MEQSEILEQIKQELQELESMPYGCECHGKTLCPNLNHFKVKLDKLIDQIISLNVAEAISAAQCLHSVKYNELRTLNDKQIQKEFERHEKSDSMISIVNIIHMHIGTILK